MFAASLALQSLGDVQALHGRHGPALGPLVGLQQAVQLLQVRHDVVFDVGDGNLQADAAAVQGSCVVSREHLSDHACHHWNNLQEVRRPA